MSYFGSIEETLKMVWESSNAGKYDVVTRELQQALAQYEMFRKTIPQKEQAQYTSIEICIKDELAAVDMIKQELNRITSPVQDNYANDDGVPDFD